MNPAVFFKNFELLADAPNGVQKLRELILQLAVMGKLVEQDSSDEPAYFLLERVRTENGTKKRKYETFLPIKEHEIKFKIPPKWVLCRLGEIIQVSSGDALPSHQMNTSGKIPVYGGNGITGYHSLNNISEPSIIIGRVGYYCGSVHITPNLAWVTDNAFSTYFSESNIDLKFLYWLLKSANLGKINNSTAQPVISGKKIYPIVVAIPPLSEQKRIVAKVDELMALCNKLEAHRQKKQELQSKLNSAALDRMLSAENQEEFEHYWQRICENFDLLYDNPENVEKLRQAILQLAVQGKLVEQNPEDEPASVLIEKIEKKKVNSIKKRKTNESQSNYQNRNKDEKEVPYGWENLILENCIELISGQHLGVDEQNDAELGLPYLTGPADFGKLYPTATRWTEKPKAVSRKDDILITVKGAGVGKTNILSLDEAVIGRQLMAIRPICLDYKFIYLLILASYNKFQELSIGLTVPGISREDILNFQFGLPPLAEQKRIVETVEQLVGLCDELETKLRKEREESQKLVESVVKGLLENAAAGKPEVEMVTPIQAAVIQSK